MLALSESKWLRLFTFTALYFAQGVPWGFISIGYVVLLADLGLDNAAVGAAIGLAYLPWSFKILWGPLLDAVPRWRIGRRRPFIAFAEAMMGATLIGLLFVDPKQSIFAVGALLFLHNTFAAMQDVAVDGLAVDLLQEDERGTANSLMWAGKSLGVVFGGGGGTLIAKHLGWNALFVLMALCIWAIMLLPLLLRERPPATDDEPVQARSLLRLTWFLGPFALVAAVMYALSALGDRLGDDPRAELVPIVQPFAALLGAFVGWRMVDPPGFATLRRSFSFAAPWLGLGVCLLTPVGYALVSTAQGRMLRADMHLSEEQIATLGGVVDPASGVVGALIGGWLADRMGAKPTIAVFMALICGCLVAWGALPSEWGVWAFIAGWTVVFQGLISAYNAALFGLCMSLSNPAIGATQFAVFMAAVNLTYSWTSPAGGAIADHWGYQAMFAVAAVVQLAAVAVLLPLDVKQAERVYRPGG